MLSSRTCTRRPFLATKSLRTGFSSDLESVSRDQNRFNEVCPCRPGPCFRRDSPRTEGTIRPSPQFFCTEDLQRRAFSSGGIPSEARPRSTWTHLRRQERSASARPRRQHLSRASLRYRSTLCRTRPVSGLRPSAQARSSSVPRTCSDVPSVLGESRRKQGPGQVTADAWAEVLRRDLESVSRDQNRFNEVCPCRPGPCFRRDSLILPPTRPPSLEIVVATSSPC
jgi:hypothetical protein